MAHQSDASQQARRIGELISKVESWRDPAAAASVRELVEALMDLHGAAIERMLSIVASKAAGQEVAAEFGRDDLVGSLLALYGLHPIDLETRVRRAVEALESRLRKQGGGVELLSIEDGVVRLHAQPGSGCGQTHASIQSVAEELICGAAPEIVAVVIGGAEESNAVSGFVPLEKLTGSHDLIPVVPGGSS